MAQGGFLNRLLVKDDGGKAEAVECGRKLLSQRRSLRARPNTSDSELADFFNDFRLQIFTNPKMIDGDFKRSVDDLLEISPSLDLLKTSCLVSQMEGEEINAWSCRCYDSMDKLGVETVDAIDVFRDILDKDAGLANRVFPYFYDLARKGCNMRNFKKGNFLDLVCDTIPATNKFVEMVNSDLVFNRYHDDAMRNRSASIYDQYRGHPNKELGIYFLAVCAKKDAGLLKPISGMIDLNSSEGEIVLEKAIEGTPSIVTKVDMEMFIARHRWEEISFKLPTIKPLLKAIEKRRDLALYALDYMEANQNLQLRNPFTKKEVEDFCGMRKRLAKSSQTIGDFEIAGHIASSFPDLAERTFSFAEERKDISHSGYCDLITKCALHDTGLLQRALPVLFDGLDQLLPLYNWEKDGPNGAIFEYIRNIFSCLKSNASPLTPSQLGTMVSIYCDDVLVLDSPDDYLHSLISVLGDREDLRGTAMDLAITCRDKSTNKYQRKRVDSLTYGIQNMNPTPRQKSQVDVPRHDALVPQ